MFEAIHPVRAIRKQCATKTRWESMKRDYGTYGKNGTNGKKQKALFRLFRLFRSLSSCFSAGISDSNFRLVGDISHIAAGKHALSQFSDEYLLKNLLKTR
jgi:hypothetical protein